MKPRALYVHVPFCGRRCSYCDFAVDAVRRPPVDAWLDAVSAELGLVADREGWTLPIELDTVYIGGGTPSLLGRGAMPEFRERLSRFAVWGDAVEWTAEANPESFDAALAADWRDAGVNRLSLGAQTFHSPALRWMGRLHGPDGPARAVTAARGAGFDNVSVDLIFGLPLRLGRDWSADLDRTLELGPEHVSLYGLTAEPATPLGRWVREGRERLADEEVYEAEYLLAAGRLANAGYLHYEVSNFGRPGCESLHNAVYWSGSAYLGVGPGAHSFLPPFRRWNVRDWALYRQLLTDGHLPEDGAELPDEDAARLERLWLGLRTGTGLPVDRFGSRARELVRAWSDLGWAATGDGRLRLTPRGWLLLDRLAVELDAAVAVELNGSPADLLDVAPAGGPHSTMDTSGNEGV